MTSSPSFTALAEHWAGYCAGSCTNQGTTALSAEHCQYLQYYQLDFCTQAVARNYCFGVIEAAGARVAVQTWQPLTTAVGTVFVVHGYWDHAGLYHRLIRQCLQWGYAVVVYDQPGHGLSSGARAAIADFSQYSEVLDAVVAAQPDCPLPRIGIGQSTGGAVLLRHFFTRSQCFDDTILLAPLVRASRWKLLVTGHSVLSPFVKQFPRDMRTCGSQDPTYAEFLRQDSLQHGYASGLWIGAMRRWVVEFLAFAPQPGKMLYIQGDKDNTVDWRFNIAAVVQRAPQVEVVMVPGAFHNLVNDAEPYRAAVMSHLQKRLQG